MNVAVSPRDKIGDYAGEVGALQPVPINPFAQDTEGGHRLRMPYLDRIAVADPKLRPSVVRETDFSFRNQSIGRSQKPCRNLRTACFDHDRSSGCEALGSANEAIFRHDRDRLARLCGEAKPSRFQGVGRARSGLPSGAFVWSLPLHS
jgi:hypothetical protein